MQLEHRTEAQGGGPGMGEGTKMGGGCAGCAWAGLRQGMGTGSRAGGGGPVQGTPNLVKGQGRDFLGSMRSQSPVAQSDKGGPNFKFCTWCWNSTS